MWQKKKREREREREEENAHAADDAADAPTPILSSSITKF